MIISIRKDNVNSLFCMWRLLFFLNLKCMEFFIYYVWLFKIIIKKMNEYNNNWKERSGIKFVVKLKKKIINELFSRLYWKKMYY